MGGYLWLTTNGKKLEIKEVSISKEENKHLEELQRMVGGLIDIPIISRKLYKLGIDIIINDEGKILNLTPTAMIMGTKGTEDILHGNLLFAGYDKEGNTIPLTALQKEVVMELFSQRKTIKRELLIIPGMI